MTDRSGRKNAGAGLGQADYERLAEFRYLVRRFLLFSQEAAEDAGLAPQQHQALLAIKAHRGPDPMTVTVLAERLAIRHHSAVGLIDRLATKGLIRRGASPTDRRQVLVELTAEAEELLRGLSIAHSDELKRVARLLRELLAAFDGAADQA